MSNPVRLETERLILREFREEDIDAYAEMCADPEVMRFLGGVTMNRGDAWRHMASVVGHWTLRGYGLFAVEEKSTGNMVGRIGPWFPEGWPDREIGWTLLRSAWGKGYATEAAKASLQYAFTELDWDHAISLIDPNNVASIFVASRIGERIEGETQIFNHTVHIFGITNPAKKDARKPRP